MADEILNYTLVLPFLRADKIPEAVQIITAMGDALGNIKVDTFIKYVRRWWLPLAEIISTWDVAIKTNNICENYNMLINRRFRRHPELWKMLGNKQKKYMAKFLNCRNELDSIKSLNFYITLITFFFFFNY